MTGRQENRVGKGAESPFIGQIQAGIKEQKDSYKKPLTDISCRRSPPELFPNESEQVEN